MDKKVLIFIEDGSYTYDNRVIREAKALVSAGFDVTVICPRYPDDPYRKRINGSLRVYFYPKINAKRLMGHLIEHLSTLFLGSILTLFVFLRHGFSVFHACNPIDILFFVAMPYKMLGKRFIFDHHDLCPELFLSRKEGAISGEAGFFYRLLLFLEKVSIRFSDVVIEPNESYKDMAINRSGKPKERVIVVRNGPDPSRFHEVPPWPGLKKPDEILVGYLGNMNEQDGVIHLLKAAKTILSRRSDIRFVLIGSGSHLERLKRETREMRIDAQVRFMGRLPHDRMLEVLSACDISVQPDPLSPLNDLSTMNKSMEYMAIGKPVVAFDLKETRVTCGDAAIYADPSRSDDLAEKIAALADDNALRDRLGKKGLERVRTCLAWEYAVPHLLMAYDLAMKPAAKQEFGRCKRKRSISGYRRGGFL